MKKALFALFGLVLASPPLALAGEEAEIPFAVAPMFGHNAVLQRDVPLPIWGTAAPGAKVSVCVSRGADLDRGTGMLAGEAARTTPGLSRALPPVPDAFGAPRGPRAAYPGPVNPRDAGTTVILR